MSKELTRGTCEKCGTADHLVSPFREGARFYLAVCGPCKLAAVDLGKVCADVERRVGGGVKVEVKRG